MRFALAFHPLVKYDLAEAEHWYASLDPVLIDRLLSELEAEFAALSDDALLYRPRFEDIRRVNPPVFPFGIFYFIAGETVVVLGILHAAR
ncbi:MAG: type II toxin-antitoxin system RelE/ParE family toxin, partial [Chthoniobacter sp.]